MKEITKPDGGLQLRCSDETIRAIHRWKTHFQLVYKREFTYEEVVIRALECLYFGDTNTDMLTGHNAGVTTVGVTWGFRPRTELEQYNADIIIDSAAEIPGLAGIDVIQ